MAFTGIFPAMDISPSALGLFAVANPSANADEKNEDKWTRGFSQEYNSRPSYVRLWDDTSAVSYVVADNNTAALFIEITPIFIEVEDFHSTFGLVGDDRFKRATTQLEAVSQKALEAEFCDGKIARSSGLANTYLAKSTASVINSGTAYSSQRAIAILENSISQMSPAGESGIVHMTRDIMSLLSSTGQLFANSTDSHLATTSGAAVVVGSGYTGNGPHIAISTIAVTSNVATIVTATSHYLVAGESFAMTTTAGGTAFDGTFTVATVTNATTFTASITKTNQGATATPGNVQMLGSDSTKWMYATGTVAAHLGESIVVNETLAQGYGVTANNNTMRIKATRAAVAYFDPSIHLAIKVNLTA